MTFLLMTARCVSCNELIMEGLGLVAPRSRRVHDAPSCLAVYYARWYPAVAADVATPRQLVMELVGVA